MLLSIRPDTAAILTPAPVSRIEDERGDKPFLTAKIDGNWISISYAEAAEKVCLMAENLRKIGLRDGDRVVIVAENRPEWCIAVVLVLIASGNGTQVWQGSFNLHAQHHL